MHLDFVVVSNKGPEFYPVHAMRGALDKTKVELGYTYVSEEVLHTGQINGKPIPQQALLYVHGDYNGLYGNVTLVRRLAPQREDLRFIIHVDPIRHAEMDFTSPEDYQLVRQSVQNQG